MMGLMQEGEEKAAWEKIAQRPFPKLIGGYISACEVTRVYMNCGITQKFGLVAAWQWLEEIGADDPDTPMPGRYYTHVTFPYSEPWEDKSEELYRMQADLNKLGCHAVFCSRNIMTDEDVWSSQFGLFLPHMTLPKTPDGLLRCDIEGAAIMLAYLLDKGLVKKDEIPKDDVDVHGRALKNLAFGPVILMMAQTPQIQAKIRSLGDEPAVIRE